MYVPRKRLTNLSLISLVVILLGSMIAVFPKLTASPAHAKGRSAIPPVHARVTAPQLKSSYGLPKWWRPCLQENSNGLCIQWDTTKSPVQCDKSNYVYDVQNVKPTSIKVLTDASGKLAIWRGIAACGPEPRLVSSKDHIVNFYPGWTQEQEFECTELVKRYLALAYSTIGVQSLAASGDQVVNVYTTTYPNIFHRVDNTDSTSALYNGTLHMVPVEGDVLSYSSIHTSIVTGSDIDNNGNGTVSVIEQNADLSGIETLTVTNWIIGSTVSSWMTTRPVSVQKNWSTVQSDPSVTNGGFQGVTTLSNGEAYAVGWENDINGIGLIEHYVNGVWKKVVLPPNTQPLYGVSASSSTDIWAVGGSGEPFIMHGNGTSWQVVSVPLFETCYWSYFSRVIAFAPSDVWVVGRAGYQPCVVNGNTAMIAHWDGTTWTLYDSHAIGTLFDIKGTSDNLWAVGTYLTPDGSTETTIADHWNGYFWTNVAIPAQTSYDGLNGVAVLGINNVWVSGTSSGGKPTSALLEHWNGTSWTAVNTSAITPASLFTPMASFGSDVWAAGYKVTNPYNPPPFVYHYVQTTWVPMRLTISSGAYYDALSDMTFASNHTIWAVGTSYTSFPTTGIPLIWQNA